MEMDGHICKVKTVIYEDTNSLIFINVNKARTKVAIQKVYSSEI